MTEDCIKFLNKILEDFRPIFAKAAIGDFSQDVGFPDGDDEAGEFYAGLQTMLDVIRTKVRDLEMEVGERQEVEGRLRARTNELAEGQKALMNVLEDLEKAKNDAEQSRAWYESLLLSIGDGVIAIDSNDDVAFVNDTALKILRLRDKSELLGKNATEATQIEDKDGKLLSSDERLYKSAMVTGKPASSADLVYVRHDKTKFSVQVTASPIILNGKVVGAIDVFRDITKEKELEKVKTEFISIASHQLRTPVSALNWISESLRSSMSHLDKKQEKYFEDFSVSISRLVRLVEDLLNVSRIELGTLKLDVEDIDTADFIKDFLAGFKSYADLKKHELSFKNKSRTRIVVWIDPKVLRDVIQNLVGNAIDYSPPGTVAITLEKEGDFAKVSVMNRGPMISEEEKNKLFQKFYRGETGKSVKPEGTGLGLYIVKSLVEKSGGKIDFVSEDRETVFWFTLPIVKQ